MLCYIAIRPPCRGKPPHSFQVTSAIPYSDRLIGELLLYPDVFFFLTLLPSSFWTKAVVTGVFPFPPRFSPTIFIAHRVQQSHCSSIFHRVLLTHAPALSASQFVDKKKSQRIYTSMHSLGGARTHKTDLYQARGYPDTPPGRPVKSTP